MGLAGSRGDLPAALAARSRLHACARPACSTLCLPGSEVRYACGLPIRTADACRLWRNAAPQPGPRELCELASTAATWCPLPSPPLQRHLAQRGTGDNEGGGRGGPPAQRACGGALLPAAQAVRCTRQLPRPRLRLQAASSAPRQSGVRAGAAPAPCPPCPVQFPQHAAPRWRPHEPQQSPGPPAWQRRRAAPAARSHFCAPRPPNPPGPPFPPPSLCHRSASCPVATSTCAAISTGTCAELEAGARVWTGNGTGVRGKQGCPGGDTLLNPARGCARGCCLPAPAPMLLRHRRRPSAGSGPLTHRCSRASCASPTAEAADRGGSAWPKAARRVPRNHGRHGTRQARLPGLQHVA